MRIYANAVSRLRP